MSCIGFQSKSKEYSLKSQFLCILSLPQSKITKHYQFSLKRQQQILATTVVHPGTRLLRYTPPEQNTGGRDDGGVPGYDILGSGDLPLDKQAV